MPTDLLYKYIQICLNPLYIAPRHVFYLFTQYLISLFDNSRGQACELPYLRHIDVGGTRGGS